MREKNRNHKKDEVKAQKFCEALSKKSLAYEKEKTFEYSAQKDEQKNKRTVDEKIKSN